MRKYEMMMKNEKTGRYFFTGWGCMLNEDFCIDTRTRGKYTYKTYKMLNGEIYTYRYGSYFDED